MMMKRIMLLSALVAAIVSACARTDEQAQRIARGKYIVENVGLCADCHTPHDERGEFIKEKWLQGSELVFAPTVPMPWAPAAPRIAGLPRLSETEVASLLETGATPSGWRPRPPMPPFRLSHEDAASVAAYLKSLGSDPETAATSAKGTDHAGHQ